MLLLVCTQTAGSLQTYSAYNAAAAPIMLVPNVSGRPMPVFVAPHQPQVPAAVGGNPMNDAGTVVAGNVQQSHLPLAATLPAVQPPHNEEEDLKQASAVCW